MRCDLRMCRECWGRGKKHWWSIRPCFECGGTGEVDLYSGVTFSIIVAQTLDGVIGKDGKIPWHLPSDLTYFKHLTMDKTVIMGQKTYESIESSLPGRRKIIISDDPNYVGIENDEGLECICSSFEEAIAYCYGTIGIDVPGFTGEEVFIIGGGQVHKQALDFDVVDRMYVTTIYNKFEGDTFFPKVNHDKWTLRIGPNDFALEINGNGQDAIAFSRRYFERNR